MTVRLRTIQRFFGVGQGLFADGLIYVPPTKPARFRWVYDCGTSSSQELIEAALRRFRARPSRACADTKDELDLLTLSHFDKDHISGVVRLLADERVDALVIPYMPLWQRLALAFIEDVQTNDPLFGFFVNPVGYVDDLQTQLKRIILVPPAGRERASNQGSQQPPLPTDPKDWTLDGDFGYPPADQQADAALFGQSSRIAVQWLRPGGKLSVARAWEFVPYNDCELAELADPDFVEAVARHRDSLVESRDTSVRAQALADLRNLYRGTFKGSEKQNLISLFMFAGPYPRPEFTTSMYRVAPPGFGDARAGTLYTGDGYLDKPSRFERLERHLGEERMGNLGCLQVMHHGAEGNYHAGLAEKLKPAISVFSSDPGHRGLRHPHRKVAQAFAPFGPVQADKKRDVEIGIDLSA